MGAEKDVDEAVVRYWERVSKHESGCWIWLDLRPAGKSRDWLRASGATIYGTLLVGDHYVPAHRFSYELHKGSIAKGLVIHHTCDVKRCVNPDHLVACTHRENRLDYGAKIRGPGWKVYAAKQRTLREIKVHNANV